MCKICDIRVKFIGWHDTSLEDKVVEVKSKLKQAEAGISRWEHEIKKMQEWMADEQMFLSELEFEINSRKRANSLRHQSKI